MAEEKHRPSIGAVGSEGPASRTVGWLRLAAVLCGAALGLEILCIVLASPRLAVREIVLQGDARLIEEAAPRLRLPVNTNILRAPVGLLREQVEAVPGVRRAYVVRDFPRRLTVTLEPREAIAVIRCDDVALLVDRQGVVFTIRDEWCWGLPELSGPHLTEEEARGKEARGEIACLLAVLDALGPEPRVQVARVALDRDKGTELLLESGTRVELGAAEQLEVKARLLGAAIEQLGEARIEYLNLSEPRAAYWRPRGKAVSAAWRW
jgi:cell division septal protein FtsQ